MEIKPQELRIGNFLDRNGLMRVAGISDKTIRIFDTVNNRLCVNNFYNDEFIKPIALTPEWLEKFGFVYNGGSGYKAPHNTEHWYFTLRNGFMPNSIARGSIKTDDYIGCKYVHQLQNLYFALTGKELAIDNKSL